ncbi:hypothetical protein ACHAXS_000196 [Conticribra weissflogii]
MDIITSTAFSLTLSGNSGISPFLTMFLIGVTERISPDQFNMGATMDKIMSSWPSLLLWSALTILEYVGKCVPVIDQIMDGVEAFIVPLLTQKSTLATSSTFGAYGSNSDNNNSEDNDENERSLSSANSLSSGIKTFFQIIIIFIGILLALSLHFFKMLIRLLGVGCLTQFLTVVEATIVIAGVLISVFVRKFAVFFAGCMLLAAGYNAKRRYEKWEETHGEEERRRIAALASGGNDERAPATEYERMEDVKDVQPPGLGNSGSAHV